MNIGDRPLLSEHGLVTTVAWRIGGKTTYALEGSAFIAGAAVQWLRDGLGIIKSAKEIEALARSVAVERRRRLRSGARRAGRAALGSGRARHHHAASRAGRRRPPRPRHARGHRVRGPRPARRDGEGREASAVAAARRRGRGRERSPDAVSGRHRGRRRSSARRTSSRPDAARRCWPGSAPGSFEVWTMSPIFRGRAPASSRKWARTSAPRTWRAGPWRWRERRRRR